MATIRSIGTRARSAISAVTRISGLRSRRPLRCRTASAVAYRQATQPQLRTSGRRARAPADGADLAPSIGLSPAESTCGHRKSRSLPSSGISTVPAAARSIPVDGFIAGVCLLRAACGCRLFGWGLTLETTLGSGDRDHGARGDVEQSLGQPHQESGERGVAAGPTMMASAPASPAASAIMCAAPCSVGPPTSLNVASNPASRSSPPAP